LKIPCVKKPCRDCPFRKDTLEGWLGKERMSELLNEPSFVCHKNTDLQCAGHMIIKKESNGFVALASLLNTDLKLKGHELVFSTDQACIDHHTY
jgi:hypothetical protein